MAHAARYSFSVTTAADGSATGYSPVITGRIINVLYAKTDFAAGVDFAITMEATGQGVWTEANVDASKTVAPRQATHDNAGVASLYAAGGEPVEDYIFAANDRVKVAITNGGDAKTGTFTVIVA